MRWMSGFRALWAWLVVVSLVLAGSVSSSISSVSFETGDGHARTKSLAVDVPLKNEYLLIDGPANVYEPIGLEPLNTYELRVSFVSTRSAQIHFGFNCQRSLNTSTRRPQGHMSRNRRLLHAEKLVFSTDVSGHMIGSAGHRGHCLLTVSVVSWGRMRHKSKTTGDFFYDVILEKNVLGVPASGLPLLGYALFVLAAILLTAVRLQDTRRWFGWFLNRETEEKHA